MTNHKQQILSSIRKHDLTELPLPELENDWITYPDRQSQFAEMVQAVGGECIRVENIEELNRELEKRAAYTDAKKLCSQVPGAGKSTVELDGINDPHELENIDFAILPGQFGVAENGAVWCTDDNLKHRALYFITQHLALVLPADAVVDNMHAAYERLKNEYEPKGFGTFISGPSKTADIEQSLVIGAHGSRSLVVFLVKKPTA